MDLKSYLEKLRALPDKQKKIVPWTIVIILGPIMGFFWVRGVMTKLSEIGNELGNIQLPQIEIPEISNLTAQTADWKTYKNEKYGFEIKYPDGWSVKENLSNKKFSVLNDDNKNYPSLVIKILDKTYQEAIDEQVSADEENDIIIDDVVAKEFLFNNPTGATEQLIIASKNNKTIEINSFKNSILDPILFTFKFIDN